VLDRIDLLRIDAGHLGDLLGRRFTPEHADASRSIGARLENL
jgi:hypothetical protein